VLTVGTALVCPTVRYSRPFDSERLNRYYGRREKSYDDNRSLEFKLQLAVV
jgi:hypothetical protein